MNEKKTKKPKSFARGLGPRGYLAKLLFTPAPYVKLSGCSLVVLIMWIFGIIYWAIISYTRDNPIFPLWCCNLPAAILFLIGFLGRASIKSFIIKTNIEPPYAYQRYVVINDIPIQSRWKRFILYLSIALWFGLLIGWLGNYNPLSPDQLALALPEPKAGNSIAYFALLLLSLVSKAVWSEKGWAIGVFLLLVLVQELAYLGWLLKLTTAVNRFVLPLWLVLIVVIGGWLVFNYPFVI